MEENLQAAEEEQELTPEQENIPEQEPQLEPVQEEPLTKAEILAALIRKNTADNMVTPLKELWRTPPEGLEAGDVKELLADLSQQEAFAGFACIAGQKDRYFFDAATMTENYAHIAAMLADKDLLETIAQMVRFDSKTYPRPSKMSAFMDKPYNFSADEILGAVARMKAVAEFADIATVTASNGKICLYSSTYLSPRYAQALCEEIEVERQQFQ